MAMPKESVLLGKFFFLALLGIAQMVVLFVYGELMFRVGMFRDLVTLSAIVLTWVATASSFGMFIATFSKSAKQADSLATILILTMAALGGCWFPLQMMNLPLAMDVITKSMMTYWAMEALQGLLWNNLNLLDSRMLLALGIQWCWTFALGDSLCSFTAEIIVAAKTDLAIYQSDLVCLEGIWRETTVHHSLAIPLHQPLRALCFVAVPLIEKRLRFALGLSSRPFA